MRIYVPTRGCGRVEVRLLGNTSHKDENSRLKVCVCAHHYTHTYEKSVDYACVSVMVFCVALKHC